MKIELLPTSSLRINPDNPRVIRDERYAKLVKSIREFPKMLEIRPIVVNSDMMVLGGNMRLRACKEAGLKKVPVIRAEGLTEDEQRRFIIADNVAFGEMDWDVIANSWDTAEMAEWGQVLPDFILQAEQAHRLNTTDEWVGMPDFEPGDNPFKIIVNFETEEDRLAFVKKYPIKFLKQEAKAWTTWFPFREQQDIKSVKYE